MNDELTIPGITDRTDLDKSVIDIFKLWYTQELETLGADLMMKIVAPFINDPSRSLSVNSKAFGDTWVEITIAAAEVLEENK